MATGDGIIVMKALTLRRRVRLNGASGVGATDLGQAEE